MKKPLLIAVILSLFSSAFAAETGVPIRPLAQDYVAVDTSPDQSTVPIYTPSILALPNGRLLAANERSGRWRQFGNPWARLYTSDDHGATWQLRATGGMTHARLFKAGKSIYYLGHTGDLKIMRSDDNGTTWSKEQKLTQGQGWHQSACNVWYAKGNIYLVMERSIQSGVKGWAALAPILMRAKETADLTKPESWTYSDGLAMQDAIPGFKDSDPEMDYFGVPFFKMTYPDTNVIAPKRPMHTMGWFETNVVQITDPDHYWYDSSGNTFYLVMRTHTGGTGYAGLLKVVENKNGTMSTHPVTVPSGKIMYFLPFPGGQMRFHITYDKKTKLYWLLGTQATDSMSRAETLPPDRFDLPNNERQRLVLHFSKNLVDWCFAGLVAVDQHDKASRHYAAMDIDGDDLVILARSGDKNSQTAHNGNLATFHRVKNFRSLVY